MKSPAGIPWFAAQLAAGLARRHPYRDAILGDLEEEFAAVCRSAGKRAARTWYRRQLFRSALPLLRALGPDWLPFSLAIAAAGLAYAAILAADAAAALALDWLAPAPGRALYATVAFGTILAVGIVAVRMVRKVPRYRKAAIVSLLLVAGLLGARHIWRSRPGERAYRTGKVAAVMAAIAVGAAPAIPRRGTRKAQPR